MPEGNAIWLCLPNVPKKSNTESKNGVVVIPMDGGEGTGELLINGQDILAYHNE